MSTPKEIVIAGASGYIGLSLIPSLLKKFPEATITALSRSNQESTDNRVNWKACDLFSLKGIEAALPEKVDMAFYLVHSMGPTAQLDQGSFADYDLILADNFARALGTKKIKQLNYLGGLIPDIRPLSLHLQSRLEVEETFKEHNLPLTVFRAGLILGKNGSSFQILLKLVKRLPIMVCPSWTQTLTAPIDLTTAIEAMAASCYDEASINREYDLAGCKPITYIEMMRETALALGKRRYFLTVPFFTPTLSRLWVSLITNSPKNLVYPLIDSLKHPMLPRKENLYSEDVLQRNYADLLTKSNLESIPSRSIFRFRARRKTVRSVQRLPLKPNQTAESIMSDYLTWLPNFLFPFVKVVIKKPFITFCLFSKKIKLLELELSTKRSSEDRQLLYIRSGALLAKPNRGRLEFIKVLGGKYILAAIHDYQPSLPWFVYKYTQAKLHILVMSAFTKYLKKNQQGKPS